MKGNLLPPLLLWLRGKALALTDSEHLGVTYRTCTLGRRLAVFHSDGLSILYFSLGAALNTISLHSMNLLF